MVPLLKTFTYTAALIPCSVRHTTEKRCILIPILKVILRMHHNSVSEIYDELRLYCRVCRKSKGASTKETLMFLFHEQVVLSEQGTKKHCPPCPILCSKKGQAGWKITENFVSEHARVTGTPEYPIFG